MHQTMESDRADSLRAAVALIEPMNIDVVAQSSWQCLKSAALSKAPRADIDGW
jgi:hypothetical protein